MSMSLYVISREIHHKDIYYKKIKIAKEFITWLESGDSQYPLYLGFHTSFNIQSSLLILPFSSIRMSQTGQSANIDLSALWFPEVRRGDVSSLPSLEMAH